MHNFFNCDYPPLTLMLRAADCESAIAIIEKPANQTAEAFCFLTESLLPEYKTKKSVKRIIDSMRNRPVYVTNYIRDNSQPFLTDKELSQQLLNMIDCGAGLIDVRGDMFCRTNGEFTKNPSAVKQQKELISEIHRCGAKALISTHIFEYRTPKNILEIALAQEERGADIAKIVTEANSEKEADDAFKTLFLLKENLKIPFLFLCNGSHCKNHRLLSSLLGNCMCLCVENENKNQNQPTLQEAENILKIVKKEKIKHEQQ